MIDLSDDMIPNGFSEELVDFGFLQQPSSGAESVRVNRPGTRMRVTLSFPPMRPEQAMRVLPRLKRA